MQGHFLCREGGLNLFLREGEGKNKPQNYRDSGVTQKEEKKKKLMG